MSCKLPPPGWRCSRGDLHDGPCAAVEDVTNEELREIARQVAEDYKSAVEETRAMSARLDAKFDPYKVLSKLAEELEPSAIYDTKKYCYCGSGNRLHQVGEANADCEYYNHHCDSCHEHGYCTQWNFKCLMSKFVKRLKKLLFPPTKP